MDRFPQELVAAMARVFPRGNPSTDSWQQARGRPLEIGVAEAQNSDNFAMSVMFAVIKAFDRVEGSLRRVSGALGQATMTDVSFRGITILRSRGSMQRWLS
jgi:hypothetical protein